MNEKNQVGAAEPTEENDASDIQHQIDACREEIVAALRGRLADVRGKYEELVKGHVSEWTTQAEAIEGRIDAFGVTLEELRRERTELESQCAELKRSVAELEASARALRGQLKEARLDCKVLDGRYGHLLARTNGLNGNGSRRIADSVDLNEGDPDPDFQSMGLRGGVYEFLRRAGLEVVDKRPHGRYLWVLGERGLVEPVLDQLREQGCGFTFSEGGEADTLGRPGWYTKAKK